MLKQDLEDEKRLEASLHRVEQQLLKATERRAEVLNIVRTMFTYLKSGFPEGDAVSPELAAELKAATEPTTTLGAILDVILKRSTSSTGASNTDIPAVLINFAMSACQASKKGYNLLRALIPDLPCYSTVDKNKPNLSERFGCHNWYIERLLQQAADASVDLNTTDLVLMNDDMNILSVCPSVIVET